MPLLTDEEIAQARSEAQKEMGFGQPSTSTSSPTVFSAPAINIKLPNKIEEKEKQDDLSLPGILGSGFFAVAPSLGVGDKFIQKTKERFQPAELFQPKSVTPASEFLQKNPYTAPKLQQKIKDLQLKSIGITPPIPSIQGGLPSNNQPSQTSNKGVLLTPKASVPSDGGLPVNTSTETISDATKQINDPVKEIQQRIENEANAKRRPPGEMEHNAEQNRIRLTTEQNLGQSGAKGQIVNIGTLRWDPISQTYVPPSIFQERTRQQAEKEHQENQSKEAEKKQQNELAEKEKKAKEVEKQRMEKIVEEEKKAKDKAKLELEEAQKQFENDKKLYEEEKHKKAQTLSEKAEAKSARLNAMAGKTLGTVNLVSGVYGGYQAGKHGANALKEYIKNNKMTEKAKDEAIKAGTGVLTALPNSKSQAIGHGVNAYREYKKNGLSEDAILEGLMSAGSGAMASKNPYIFGGGALLTGIGMGYPFVKSALTDPEHNKEADIATRSTP
jgi:chemotaxis protein histidine kinase CheA